MLLPGEYHKNELINRFNLKANDERLKVVGWPMVDDFFNGVFDRGEILNSLGLDSRKKTVMYAPTWWQGDAGKNIFSRNFGKETEVFENLCKKVKDLNLNFIVKLHCLSFHANNQEMISIAEKYGVLWLTKETSCFQSDPNPFLWVTDILLSDMSGIITEFLTLNRPIIYIDPAEDLNVWQESDMPRNFRAGHVVKTSNELMRAVEESVNFPEQFKSQRQSVANEIFYRLDGKAIDRAVNEIFKFVENKQFASK